MDYDQVCDDYLDTGSKIFEEWELNTPEKFKERDKALHKLLTTKKFSFPSILPDGNYSAQVEQVENIRSHAIALPSKFKKKHVDKITGFSVANDVLQFDSDSFGLDRHAEFVYGSNFAIGSSKRKSRRILPHKTLTLSMKRTRVFSTLMKMAQKKVLGTVASVQCLWVGLL